MKLKLSLIVAIIVSIITLIAWESFWRSKADRYSAVIEDDRYLWAEQRAKVESATSEDVVIIGSSRTAFNFNTNIWQNAQGIKPINWSHMYTEDAKIYTKDFVEQLIKDGHLKFKPTK